jgi:hypothetical protein
VFDDAVCKVGHPGDVGSDPDGRNGGDGASVTRTAAGGPSGNRTADPSQYDDRGSSEMSGSSTVSPIRRGGRRQPIEPRDPLEPRDIVFPRIGTPSQTRHHFVLKLPHRSLQAQVILLINNWDDRGIRQRSCEYEKEKLCPIMARH